MNSRWSMARRSMAALVCAVPLGALAADKTMPVSPSGISISFEALDVNKDGRVSLPEASADASLVEAFSSADKNGDGYLDNAEYDRVKKAKRNDEQKPR